MRQADAILCADLHMMERTPPCRTDDYQAAMWTKIDFILELVQEHHCPVLYAGDIFDKPRVSPALEVKALELPYGICAAGNHDLPAHSFDRLSESSLGVLDASGCLDVNSPRHKEPFGSFEFDLYHWGLPLQEPNRTMRNDLAQVALCHHFTYTGRVPFPGVTEENTAEWVMEQLPHDLVVTGDNHQTFVYEHHDGRILVNPGSMMRMTAAQIKHRPSVFLWYAEDNEVERVYLPIEKGVVSREHLDRGKEIDERVELFVSRLDGEIEDAGLSFRQNIDTFMEQNKVPERVRKIVEEDVHG